MTGLVAAVMAGDIGNAGFCASRRGVTGFLSIIFTGLKKTSHNLYTYYR